MGQNETLCKHMLTLALAVLDRTGGMKKASPPRTLAEAKKLVGLGMKKLRSYNGSSRVWFSYQRALSAGSGMITEAVSALPPEKQNVAYLWELVLRLSRKLTESGIDDSDGVVGNCISTLVEQLGRYAVELPELRPLLLDFCKDDTGFGFENELQTLLNTEHPITPLP